MTGTMALGDFEWVRLIDRMINRYQCVYLSKGGGK